MTQKITSAQVSEEYRKPVRTVNRLAKSGRLPFAMKLPGPRGAYLFDSDEVARFFGATQAPDEAA